MGEKSEKEGYIHTYNLKHNNFILHQINISLTIWTELNNKDFSDQMRLLEINNKKAPETLIYLEIKTFIILLKEEILTT